MATIGSLWINVKSNTSGLSKGLGKARGMLGKFGKFAASPAGLAVAGFAALTAAIALTVKVLGAALKEFMKFEAGMAEVKSILTDVSDSDFARLEDSAKKLGATTAFTAEEASSGMANLARAGFDTNEILAATPAVLNLASATGMELAEAANIAAVAVRGFGLEAAETAHVADVLALAASKTNTTVQEMGDAMSYVAPVAHQLGFSIEETTAMLGKLADSGIKGSKGGTALRTMMLKLGSTIEKEGTQAFYKYLEAQHSVTENMEQFGKIGVTAAGVLSNVVDETRELTTSMEEATDVVDTMAKTRLDTLAGDVTLFESAVSGLKVAIGEQLSPTMREAVQAATDFVNILTGSMGKTKQVTAEASAGMNFFEKAITGVGTVWIFVSNWFSRGYNIIAGVVNSIKALVYGVIGGIMVAIDGLVTAMAGLFEFLGMEVNTDNINTIRNAVDDLAASTYEAGTDAGANWNAAFGAGLIEPFQDSAALAEKMGGVGEDAGKSLMGGITESIEEGAPAVKDAAGKLKEGWAELIEEGTKLTTNLQDQITYFGMTASQTLIAKAAEAGLTSATIEGTLALEQQLQALKDKATAEEEAIKKTEALKDAATKLIESLRTPKEVYDDEAAKLQEMMDKKLLTYEQHEKALEKLRKGTEKDIEVNIITKGIVEGLQSALGSIKVAGQVNKVEQLAQKQVDISKKTEQVMSAVRDNTQQSLSRLDEVAAKSAAVVTKLNSVRVSDVSGLQSMLGTIDNSINNISNDNSMAATEQLLGTSNNLSSNQLSELQKLNMAIGNMSGSGGALT